MKYVLASQLVLLTVLVLVGVACAEPSGPDWVPGLLSEQEAAAGYYPLFNGYDLDGWIVRAEPEADAIVAQEGTLTLRKGAQIYTTYPQGNCVLRLEYTGRPVLRFRDDFTGTELPSAEAWTAVTIRCEGDRASITVDGHDDMDRALPAGEGPIVLGCDPSATFRRMRLLPLPGGPGWRPLFNGKDLSGWRVVGDGTWRVLDGGVLRFDGAGMHKHSGLQTESEFRDFEMRLSVRTHDDANSGVFFRGTGSRAWPRSYEAQIDNHDPDNFTGAVYDQVPALELRARDNAWFRMRIRALGPRIEVAVNGKTVVELVSPKYRRYPQGWISLQGHDDESVVDFKDIEIRPITTPDPVSGAEP